MTTKTIPTRDQVMTALTAISAGGDQPGRAETNLLSLVIDLESHHERAIAAADGIARDMERLAETLVDRDVNAVVNPLGELQSGRHLDTTLASFAATQKAVLALLDTLPAAFFEALAGTEA